MRKLYILGLIALAAIIIGFAWAEQITLTTYYPAPYGVYREFTTTGNTYLATQEGNVGIGTSVPAELLHIKGPDAAIQLGNTDVVGGAETSIYVLEQDGSLVLSSHARHYDDKHLVIQQGTGNVGIGTADPKTALDVNGLIKTARYSWGTKPDALPDNKGAIFYNTDDDKMYYSNGSDWQPMGGGPSLGDWVDMGTSSSVHGPAATDGFVVAYSTLGHNTVGYTDSSNPPTTERIGLNGFTKALTMPVKMGDYWKVVDADQIYWIPIM